MSEETAKRCLIEARDNTATGNLCRAFDLYIKAFIIFPRLKSAYKTKFLAMFSQLMDYLEEKNDHNTLFKAYREALHFFPGNSVILTEVGRYLLRHRFYLEAWKQFQQVLSDDSSSVIAEFYLNLVKVGLVHRWHYRMLNDKTRNFSYHAAIREAVEPGKDGVLDLGTGSGLLAMYAAKCNPKSVVGIEMSDILSLMAKHVIADNNFHCIDIINNPSQCLNPFDIGGKKNLLITELFDAGLFGEGIIPVLDHAFKMLLVDNGRILPSRAEFFVRGIKCDSLMTRYCLNSLTKALLNIPMNKHVLTSSDSYDCGDVHLYEDLKYMTETESLIKVDFNNAKDLEKKLSQVEEYTLQLNPLVSGEVSTIVGWFNLHLTNHISLTTNPWSDNRSGAWQQAIFCNFLPKQVQENTPFDVTFQLANGLKLALVPDTDSDMKISECIMRFLNDEEYIETMTTCADASFMYLLQHIHVSEIVIADLSPFPIFGLMMLKGGVQTLYCYAKTKEDQDFFVNVFQANDISDDRYKILDNEQDFLGDKKFHAIYFNIFNTDGNIDTTLIKITYLMEINNLIEGGLFIPYNIRVMGQLINSPTLDLHNRVYDENTGYMIAQHMNKLQVSVNYGIDFTHFKYTPLSDPIVLGYCRGMKSEIIECPVIKDGNANAILCWYDIKVSQYSGSISTNRPNSFIDGMAFLADPHVSLVAGDIPDIICCVDDDQSFKLIIDNADQLNI